MAKNTKSTRSTGTWVAPSKGGYSAEARSGKVVRRPATPPKNGASASKKSVA